MTDSRHKGIIAPVRILPILIFLLTVPAAFAEGDAGDAAAGEKLYQENCFVCHGVGGASVVPTQPILAGQYAGYLREQLRQYQNGLRKGAVMAPMAAPLSEEDIANVALYLSQQKPVIVGADDVAAAVSAENLYRHGDIARGLPACTACHGPAGDGIAPHYPRLSGQHAVYTAETLREYAGGGRQSPVMQPIAAKLTEEEITLLSAYLSGLAH